MKARPILRLWKSQGRWQFAYYSPETVLRVRTQGDLLKLLEFYSCPFIELRTPRTKFARRHYVERVRPALRWYCRQFSVPTPTWLANDESILLCSPSEARALFGTRPLAIREFE